MTGTIPAAACGPMMGPMRRPVLAVLGAAVLLAAGCGGRAPTPLVVDTDMSTDDVLALLYVARSPSLDLRAVTVSGTGLTTCPAGARNVLQLLAVAGRPDVPVACGRTAPLAGANQFPVEWRARADALFGLELPRVSGRASPGGAVELLDRVLTLSPRKVTLLSLAPMTDTAALLRAHPDLAGRLARVVAMGGAVGVPGNVGAGHEQVEYNLWVDPLAAREVLASRVPVTLVPLDATNDVPSTIFFSEALRRHHYATPAASAAWELFVQNASLWSGGQYFWDPLAAVALTVPGALDYRDEALAVVTAPGADEGRTVPSSGGRTVRVATAARRSAFERELLRTLLGGAPFEAPPTASPVTLVFDGTGCRYTGPAQGPPGQVAFDTVNRSGRTFAFLVGDGSGDLSTSAELRGETPPHSRMTWAGYLGPGIKAVACEDGGRITVAAHVTLAAAR